MAKIFQRATFNATVDQLPLLMSWVQKQLEPLALDSRILHKLELALEEAIVNIIHHGYGKKKGTVQIEIKAEIKGEISIAIRDQAPPFDPLTQAPLPDRRSPLETRREGGLGVHLMRQCVDEIHYRREGGDNILTFVKKF